MPNLENLKKQAKQFLRWHRDGHYPVAAQISAVLPRFKDLSDHEVLRRPFKLADAQELVARQAGFETWQALKSGVQAMIDKPDHTEATASSPMMSEPELYVSDFDKARDFYTGKLGFEVVFTYGEPPFYGQVRREKALLNLRLICEPVFVGDVREREELVSAAFTLGSAAAIRQLFAEYQAAGVDFFRPLKQEPWGARTFIVRDPFGNLLLFAGTAT
jgi:catechol 2,3-dioxygenase-like lactoylglutathione lyase family enzyme